MILLFSAGEAGHRRSYLDFFARLFRSRRARVGEMFFASEPVFFLMIEENFALYILVAGVRAALRRRTVGLLFRPLPALRGRGPRLVAKRVALGLLKRIPLVSTLTILPFSVEPDFERIADGWIYDPQLWDLLEPERRLGTSMPPDNSYLRPALRSVGERRFIAAVGRMDHAKGFDSFARAYAGSGQLRDTALFVACGQVASDLALEAGKLAAAGGIVIDRQISDDELLEAYAAADAIWCCYAPDYDQASGILGRAAQLGIPVLVRAGSLIERLCTREGLSYCAIAPDDFTSLPDTIAARNPERGKAMAASMAGHSLPVLAQALGVPPTHA